MKKRVGAALVLAVTILTVLCGVLSGCKQEPHMVEIHLIDPLTGKPCYSVNYKAEDMEEETPIVIKIFDKVWEKYVTDLEYGQDFLRKSIKTVIATPGVTGSGVPAPQYWPTEKGKYILYVDFESIDIEKLGSWSDKYIINVE